KFFGSPKLLVANVIVLLGKFSVCLNGIFKLYFECLIAALFCGKKHFKNEYFDIFCMFALNC
ncbi:MAG TPA: hypothetical protein DHW31_08720, partial [Bacteroides graminisolvens]|nr:hypothetical protein [Bacteroides graminisolvens]